MTQFVSYKMNLPTELDRWIRLEAAKECRSRSGHIIRILRNAMEATAGESLGNSTPAVTEPNTAVEAAGQFHPQQ